jgi:hypothetical protein
VKGVPEKGLAQHMARIILVAQKPEGLFARPYVLQDIKESGAK